MLEAGNLQTPYICLSLLVFFFLSIFFHVTASAIKTCSLKTLKSLIHEGFLYFLIVDAGWLKSISSNNGSVQ